MSAIKPQKSLGQNFLQDELVLEQIVAAGDLSVQGKVLEIGPGKGVLTRKLVQKAQRIIAVEKDGRLVDFLAKQSDLAEFAKQGKLKLVQEDILKLNLPQLIEENDFEDYKLIANIPYYITGQLIRLFLETKFQPELLVLLVQKEVAERICATAGKMSVLTLAVQFFGKAELVGEVSKDCFSPVPKVDSAILKITPHQKPPANQEEILRLAKIGFASRRKTLVNNLAAGLRREKSELKAILEKLALPAAVRAQDLSLADWVKLNDLLKV